MFFLMETLCTFEISQRKIHVVVQLVATVRALAYFSENVLKLWQSTKQNQEISACASFFKQFFIDILQDIKEIYIKN